MPELPEVETTTKGLQKTVVGQKILDVWTDLDSKDKRQLDTIKNPAFFKYFKREVIGKKIIGVKRIGKNILIALGSGDTILIHMKMTGHLLYGKYRKVAGSSRSDLGTSLRSDLLPLWLPAEKGPLQDPYNRFVHVVFSMSSGKHLAFCDSRKFGKITLIKKSELHTSKHTAHLGPDPTDKNFSFENFKERLFLKPSAGWRRKIKSVLMDQTIITGIGNIYSDEILWMSSIHPEARVQNIPKDRLRVMFKSMKQILAKGIDFGGDSMSDYRNILGKKGEFQLHHNAYMREGEKCGKKGCHGVIIRIVVEGRSSHLCPSHQKLTSK